MKQIPLTNGLFALVDDEDFDRVNQYKWQAYKATDGLIYAVRRIKGETHKKIRMHRFIMNTSNPNIKIDHRNSDSLDNQKHNLRIATNSQNQQNRRKTTGLTSIYKGVCRVKHRNLYRSTLYINRKPINLGYFKDEIMAAQAYNLAAEKYFGEFAKVNII
jgi:hypothetical protein